MRMNALWWWIDRWRKSTAYTDMTLEQQGAYRNLIDEAQLRGGAIPNDERILAKSCGDALAWKKLRAVVMARFELTDDGWRNTTLDEVIRESKRRKEKQQRYRIRHGNDAGNASGNDAGNDDGNGVGTPDPSPSPDQAPDPGGHTRARTSSGVMAGALPRDHLRHAYCGRVCVPDFIHGEFLQKIGGIEPDASVRRFYDDVLDSIPADQPIGDDPVKFWRAQFSARFGTVATIVSGKTSGNIGNAARFVARGRA